MPSTGEWLCTDSKYIDWFEKGSNNMSERLLWVNGKSHHIILDGIKCLAGA
jgi:hypothetical protein